MIGNQQQSSLRVALYLRVSTDEQVERYGKKLQQEALLGLIKARGKLDNGLDAMVLAGDQYIYFDEGISGTVDLPERPAFAKLQEDLTNSTPEDRPFDAVAVYKIDRFARRLKILLEVIDFFGEYDVQFLSATESIDTSTPFGKAILNIIGVIAELEVETIKQRTQAGREQAIKNGVVMGSGMKYGFIKDSEKRLVIFEAEAEVIRSIFDMCVSQKLSAQRIAKILTEEERPSPETSSVLYKEYKGAIRKKSSPNFWRMEIVREILKDPIYIGKYYFGKTRDGKRVEPSKWSISPYALPQIIDVGTFEKAQNILAQTKNIIDEPREGHIYLLRGLLKCDACFKPDADPTMYRWIGERKKLTTAPDNFAYYYKCARKNTSKYEINCFTIPLPAEEIERYVVTKTKEFLQNPEAVFKYQQKLKSTQSEKKHFAKKREQLRQLLDAMPARKNNILEQHKLGYIKQPKLKEEMEKLEKQIVLLTAELEKLDLLISKNAMPDSYISSLNVFNKKYSEALNDIFGDRRELDQLLHALIEEIIIYSRPSTAEDSIAGRRKEKQLLPYEIRIKLKLPQDILGHIAGMSSGRKLLAGGSPGTRTQNPRLKRPLLYH